MKDIQNSADIDLLVKCFYEKVLIDDIIGFLFTDIAQIDIEHHLPKISQFWQRQLLGITSYRGRVFETHQRIHEQVQLTEHHFHRWLFLFTQTIDELFCGERATLAKQRAKSIAKSMLEGLQDRHMQSILERREAQGVFIFEPDNSHS
jgi:hemoglobin